MKLGVIADDFTGASDIALTLAEGGMTVSQFVGVPATAALSCDAGVISLKSRTAPKIEAVAQSLAAGRWLLAQGCTQIVFKVCSTFDSTDDGNIGPVIEALADLTGETRVLVCPAFPENGRSVYQGHLFVGDHPLHESGMQHHPLTPMTDPDLRRVLQRQTNWNVDHIDARTVFQGADAITARNQGAKAMVIVDAIRDSDLIAIGTSARDRFLLCGGSGIALGLPANFGITRHSIDWQGAKGRGVVLSGSCSAATRAQVAFFKERAPFQEIIAASVMDGTQTAQGIAEWVLAQDAAPLVYSSADPAAVRAAQVTYGKEVIAAKIEDLFRELSRILAKKGVTRIVSAGGETSGAVIAGLGAKVLHIGPRIAPGVPALKIAGQNMAVALKSGNFGDEQFFQTALDQLEAKA